MESDGEDSRKLYCGNLAPDIDEELLHELFLQAGPVEKIILPKNYQGDHRGFAFVVFKHECSVLYAIDLFRDTALFGRLLNLREKRGDGGNANHQRSHSEPSSFRNHPPNPPQNFDALLALSQSLLVGNMQQAPTWPQTFNTPPVPLGGVSNFTTMQPWNMYQSVHPNEQLSRNNHPSTSFPGSNENTASLGTSSLSRSSLLGNWSARNDSNMLPADNFRRPDNHRRSDRDFRARSDFGRTDHRRDDSFGRDQSQHYDRNDHRRGRSFDRNQDYRDDYGGGRSRGKSDHDRYSDKSERDGHRNRDFRDRRGRY